MDKQTKLQIQEWLDSGRDHTEGLMLFLKYSRNKNLARFLSNVNERALKMLPQEIAKIIGVPHGDRPATSDGSAAPVRSLRVVASPKAKQPAAAADNKYKGLITAQPGDTEYHTEARKALEIAFRERTNLHGILEQLTDEEVRHETAQEIADKTEQIDCIIAALQHFEATNQWPAEIQEAIKIKELEKTANVTIPESVPDGFDFKDMGKVVARIATVRTYISRSKNEETKKKWETELLFMEQVRDGIIQF